ncbi:putative F420-0 ABC transporter substrate-binding protein [Actinotalea sp. C106]|uniref:putative F420-0 ABC transporter substrate-binding protein n=1 Tax=Actinotalea sp. C106 TaxID=2908644 RepID=UPI0020280330|nr:putative F420-0 ABC transporter substrate-binding protein [Actinotalea sp. C106]
MPVRLPAPRPGRRAALGLSALAASSALLVACSTPAEEETPEAPAPAASLTSYPVTVDSCGTEVTLEESPERVVAIKSSAIEMVLALGAGDRLVGTGFADGPVPADLTEAATDLPVLSDEVPAAEVVLETEPDLVYAGWESNFSAEGAGERGMLAELGVATYVSPAACKDPAYQPDRLSFEDVFAEITEVASLLGVPEAAEELVAAQQTELDAVPADDRGLTALWYSSGTDVPYVGAGIGAPQMILDAVGLENVAAEVEDTWTSFGWEEVVAADPDVIVLVDATWNSAEQKRELLATNAATANLEAVREESYLEIPFPATEAGVRNVAATAELAEQLAALDLTP